MRAAAALLSNARSSESLCDVLRAIGVPGDAVPLDAPAISGLGVDVMHASLVGAANNALRAFVVRLHTAHTIRDAIPAIARRLATRAPHVLWLVAAIEDDGGRAAIAGWMADTKGKRLVSLVWEPRRVVNSDAESLCALAAIQAADPELFHARCLEILGRDALTRRFYRALEERVDAMSRDLAPRAKEDDARTIALLYVSRLLFLSFLEAKGWLNGERDFLSTRFDDCLRRQDAFHRRVLLPLFFGTLNTPTQHRSKAARDFGRVPFLNGGLFTKTLVEKRHARSIFSDEAMGELLDRVFRRYRFVAREDSATWSEASVDPEMLGRAFESLMDIGERKAGGVFYTPHELVSRVTEHALASAFPKPTLDAARDLRVIDPACGSGAFLVYALERIADLRRELGDKEPLARVRRDVLARSIFGVDRHPTAAWLCELRLWLSVVIDDAETDPMRIPALPNLDRNIRVGDSLSDAGFASDAFIIPGSAALGALRQRYITATGKRKATLAAAIDRAERKRLVLQLDRELHAAMHARQERIGTQRSKDLFGARVPVTVESRRELKRLRDAVQSIRRERQRIADGGALPFSFGICFPDTQTRGGFDCAIGNPPWVRLHHIPVRLRETFRRTFAVYRSARWAAGAESAGASVGFASQIDLAALFVERSFEVLRPGGALSLLLPAKLWRSLAGGGVRDFLRTRAALVRLEDLSESRHAFDAAVYPSILVACASKPIPKVHLALADRHSYHEWTAASDSVPFDNSPGAPWLLLTPPQREAFERIRSAGSTLASQFGAPRLGVKCGCNAAFVVRPESSARGLTTVVDADGERGTVETELLRPALRGDAVVEWRRAPSDEAIIWTHDVCGAPYADLPPRARLWLRRRYNELAVRSDARGRRWWSLFRTASADASTVRVVWADFGKRPRALVLPRGDAAVPLNTCYVVRTSDERDAWALVSLLNSPLAAAWLNAIAEPARGGYRRYLGWTVGLLPLPRKWTRARDVLSSAREHGDDALIAAVHDAYGLRASHTAELLGGR